MELHDASDEIDQLDVETSEDQVSRELSIFLTGQWGSHGGGVSAMTLVLIF